MLAWALLFLTTAAVAAVFAFASTATLIASVAKFTFFVSLILFSLAMLGHLKGG